MIFAYFPQACKNPLTYYYYYCNYYCYYYYYDWDYYNNYTFDCYY